MSSKARRRKAHAPTIVVGMKVVLTGHHQEQFRYLFEPLLIEEVSKLHKGAGVWLCEDSGFGTDAARYRYVAVASVSTVRGSRVRAGHVTVCIEDGRSYQLDDDGRLNWTSLCAVSSPEQFRQFRLNHPEALKSIVT